MQEKLARIRRVGTVMRIPSSPSLEEAIFLADRLLLLPGRKGAWSRIIDIDLPLPPTAARTMPPRLPYTE